MAKKKSRLVLKLLIVATVLLLAGLVWLDALVQERFSGRKWTVPAKVYARPIELYAGQDLAVDDLAYELDLLGYRREQASNTPQSPGDYSLKTRGSQTSLALHTRGFRFADGVEKARKVSLHWQAGRLNSLHSADTEIDLLRLEPLQIGGIYPRHNEDRLLINMAQVPAGMIDSLLAIEDRSFYSHFGISLKGIARAFWVNARAGSLRQGGSTITQQLVKNFFLTQERSFARKLAEIPMAILLELHTEKDEILQTFLNEVFLAQDGQRSIHGFGLASQYFFNQPLSELQPHQYALLVGMIKGPSYYNPIRNPERAKSRRNLVLRVMADANVMSQEESKYARSLPLGIGNPGKRSARHPAFLDLVRRQLTQDYDSEDLENEGLRIFTSFDPILQRKAEQSVHRTLESIDKKNARELLASEDSQQDQSAAQPQLEASMVLTKTGTGEVLALVGGRNPRFAGFNRALDARRQIGSLVKPAIYLTALSNPDNYSLASKVEDTAFELPQPDGSVWAPQNFSEQSHGSVSLLQALSRSYNLASANLGLELGLPAVTSTLQKLGVTADIPEVPALLLGVLELSALDVASMYQTIAQNGFATPARSIREVLTASGEPLSQYNLDLRQQFGPDAIYLLQYALQETMREGTGQRAYWTLKKDIAVAGKTGTSNDQRDSWFAGFSGDYLGVVWLGFDDNRPTPVTGSSGALAVWSDLFTDISRQSIDFLRPQGIKYAWTDMESGQLSRGNCSGARYLPYISGTEPLANSAAGAVECVQSKEDRQRRNRRRWFLDLFNR